MAKDPEMPLIDVAEELAVLNGSLSPCDEDATVTETRQELLRLAHDALFGPLALDHHTDETLAAHGHSTNSEAAMRIKYQTATRSGTINLIGKVQSHVDLLKAHPPVGPFAAARKIADAFERLLPILLRAEAGRRIAIDREREVAGVKVHRTSGVTHSKSFVDEHLDSVNKNRIDRLTSLIPVDDPNYHPPMQPCSAENPDDLPISLSDIVPAIQGVHEQMANL